MNREFTRRELQLAGLLPTIIILCIFIYAFERPRNAALKQTQADVIAARENVIAPARLAEKQRDIDRLNAQIEIEKLRSAATTRPSLAMPARWTTPWGRKDALSGLGQALGAHRLTVVRMMPETAAHSTAPDKSMQDFIAALIRERGKDAPQPEVWKVEVIGLYSDVLASLQDVEKREWFLVPLEISMESIPETNLRRWSIWIWV